MGNLCERNITTHSAGLTNVTRRAGCEAARINGAANCMELNRALRILHRDSPTDAPGVNGTRHSLNVDGAPLGNYINPGNTRYADVGVASLQLQIGLARYIELNVAKGDTRASRL